ncbi:MAG: MATE family efflux transporter [Deltaproteobacteria bacterium]|nr:MATE family efflux transporter [Deltaproteobacteria bacterium]MBW2392917.1 MATE family efflux transporter [Deltaproteobacteria bacterium]
MSDAPLHPSKGEEPKRRGTGTTQRVWQLAWPAIATNLLHSIVGMVDIKVVGSLGASAVAAVTTGHRVFFILQGVMMAVTAGTTALVARSWGAGDRGEAERVTRTSLWMCMAFAGVLTLPGFFFADEMAGLFKGLDPETMALAASFIRTISLFNVAFAINIVLGTALRAAGDTRTPLLIAMATNLVNVFLLYGLVFGQFGLPELGVRGAAMANGMAFAFGAVLTLGLWLARVLVIRWGPIGGDFDRSRIRQILHIGYPSGLEQFVFQTGLMTFLMIVARYGEAPYAAYSIGVNILSFSFLVGFGFSIASSTLVGQNLGANDPDAAERSGWRAMFLSIGVMVVFGAVIIAVAEPFARFLIDDDEVVRLAVIFIWLLGSVQALMGIEFALSGALRGAGDTRFPLWIVFAGFFLGRIPLALVLAWLGWSVEWVFAALLADYVIKAIGLVLRFRNGRWKHAF